MSTDPVIILGSRSPRRLELLSKVIPATRIHVLTPADDGEPGFDKLDSREQIQQQLTFIARTKNDAVRSQTGPSGWGAILTADTIVIVPKTRQQFVVLGKPDGPDWKQKTRHWFNQYYSGQSHYVATAICLRTPDDRLHELQAYTEVQFCEVTTEILDWYLSTNEPLGKAGGYGLQGAAAIFVTSVLGSPTNVVGLPLLETRELLMTLNLL